MYIYTNFVIICQNILHILIFHSIIISISTKETILDNFDINKLTNGKSKNIKIGELSPEIIGILNLDIKPQDIYVWSPRILEHCEKHKNEYSSPTAYNNAIKSIPLIISNPDFIGRHSNGNLSYIKRLEDISLVGIQVIKGNEKGNLLFRTIYPITEDKLEHNLRINKYISLNNQHKKESS